MGGEGPSPPLPYLLICTRPIGMSFVALSHLILAQLYQLTLAPNMYHPPLAPHLNSLVLDLRFPFTAYQFSFSILLHLIISFTYFFFQRTVNQATLQKIQVFGQNNWKQVNLKYMNMEIYKIYKISISINTYYILDL